MFEFSRKFLRDYLPYTLELGRSFVSVEYQSSKSGSKSLYALDNLFDGIAALGVLYKDRLKYFFGKMTIYPTYEKNARDLIMYFLKKYFGEKADLIKIRKQIKVENPRRFHKVFTGLNYKENYKILKAEVGKLGVSIPPLVNTYMNMSPTMIYFGTGINDEFADVLDSGILITFEDLYPEKIDRHTNTFSKIGWRAIKSILKRFQRRG
jgi:hypothetical protein